jgi:hypothetical protein
VKALVHHSVPVLILGLSLPAVTAFAEGEPIVEKVQHGEVNWSDKTVLATGSGAPDLKLPNVAAIRLAAERAAELSAYKNIIEVLKGVRITATALGGEQLGKVQVRAQVEGTLRGCKRVDTRYFSDYGVDVVLKCPLDGALSAALVPSVEFKGLEPTGDKTISGLVVDATAVGFKPTLSPRLLADDGSELHGASRVKPAFIQKNGVAAYATSVDAAKKSERVGAAPLTVTAIGITNNEIVLSADDVAKLKAANTWFLGEGRVVIVTAKL